MLITIIIPLAAVAIVLFTVAGALLVDAAGERAATMPTRSTGVTARWGLAQYLMVSVLVLLVIATLA